MNASPRHASSPAASQKRGGGPGGGGLLSAPRAKPDPSASKPGKAANGRTGLRLAPAEREKRKRHDGRQAMEFAGASQAKLHDFPSIGLVTLDAQGMVLDMNRTVALLL